MSASGYIINDITINGSVPSGTQLEDLKRAVHCVMNPYGRNLLSVNVEVKLPSKASYYYLVHGKTADTDFWHQRNGLIQNPIVPIIGIYADAPTDVDVKLTLQNGDVLIYKMTFDFYLTTDFGPHQLKIDFEVADSAMADATINSGWLFSGYYVDAYDKNGDIRICGLSELNMPNAPLKLYDNTLPLPSSLQGGLYYSAQYDKLKMTGKAVGAYVAPNHTGFHHDITWDNDGYLYALASKFSDPSSDHDKREGIIYKFVEKTNALVADIDYSELYFESQAIADSLPNDVHFNTITYVPEIDQVIVNSRNSCSYFGIDKRSLLPIWTVQNPAHKPILHPSANLRVLNPDVFVYPNGEHTVLECHNEKYAAYWGENKFVLSVLDNCACKDINGNDVLVPNEEASDSDEGYNWDSAIQIVAIDLNARTIQQLDRFTVPGERSRITSSVFDSDNLKYLQMFIGVPTDFFVIDTKGKVGISSYKMRPDLPDSYAYRSRVFSFDTIRSMIE